MRNKVYTEFVKLIERTLYLNQLKAVTGTPDIKIITGVRRSGKSKLMDAFISFIQTEDKNANIIHINFSLLQFENLKEYHALNDYVESKYIAGVKNYLLVDEVQMCLGFEKTINSLHATEKYDIYLTGSNAFLLSSDLATLFTGRTFEIEVYPFSFEEYCRYFDKKNQYEALGQYIKEGGMAGSYLYGSENEKYRYINEDVFNALVVRDIIAKHKIRNSSLLDKLVDYLMDNVGNITSIRKISDTLASSKSKVNDKTIGSYVDYLCKAFAFYKIRRYDIKGKRYLASEDKYYLCDHSFKYARLGTKNMDFGHVLENIVAIELLRRGYEVYVGVLYKKEIDFVAIKKDEKIYIQVADDINGENTFKRETEPLLSIKDAYPKVLLARTGHEKYQYEGIQIIDMADWLLNF